MAAISADDIDRNTVTFCYEVSERVTPVGRVRTERMLPWAFVQFHDSGDPRYVAPLSGPNSVGLAAVGAQPYTMGSEYMRASAFPHEQDLGLPQAAPNDSVKAGPVAIHFFGLGGV